MTGSRPSRTSRDRVLAALRQADGALGVEEVGRRVGLHVNTVRFHLDRLVEAGDVRREAEERRTPGRPRITYRAAPDAEVEDPRNYQLLAEILAGFVAGRVPDAVESSTEAGRAWGRYLARPPRPFQEVDAGSATDELVRILDEVGFDPQLPADRPGEVRLRHCPFLEVAQEHRDVVCSIHLGLMEGALSEMQAPVTTESLVPFAEPGACIARLR